MLCARQRSGTAEVDEEFAQLFIVLEGRAAMVTGCKIKQTRQASTSQMANSNGSSDSRQELRAGDVVHTATGTAYQLLPDGDRTLCLSCHAYQGD